MSYDKLSEERKRLQEKGHLPEWMTTGGWQLFKSKYLYETDEAFLGQARRIARTAARHVPDPHLWEGHFFQLIWSGWMSCSTPVLSNMGTNRGLPVSCSGGVVPDSIQGFYDSRLETAILTKHGFGTSAYMGNIRPRGASISIGGKASGSVPVFKGFVQDMRDVAQGTARRGAWAGYLPIDHPDFDELVGLLETEGDDLNVGWNISDEFIARLNAGDEEANSRYRRALKAKLVTGKGYFFFPDKVNRASPEAYKNNNLVVKSSNLCVEIALASDEDHTFTCVLSSMNLAKYDEWKDTDAIQWATVFLDCVAEEFLHKASSIKGLEKAVRFTQKGRALGLGVCGFHTHLQKQRISIESYEAHSFNNLFFKHMREEAEKASRWLASIHGEPEWCVGTGKRNTHLLAVAPTFSTAAIMGGVSQGIEPVIANVFTQSSAGGEMERINPVFLDLMKERGKYTKKLCDTIAGNNGSVQDQDWLTVDEKKVFKTAYEVDQRALLRLASSRQRWIDQGQSLNLFFDANEAEEYISEIHQEAFEDEGIKALYYLRSAAGVMASRGECEACQ